MVSNKRNFNTEGIVLRRRNYGEADRMVVFYTKHQGKMVCLAKGVRRPTSRKRASIELFTQVNIGGVTHRSMSIVTETVIVNSYSEIRQDYQRVGSAYRVCEIIDRLTAEGSETVGVYSLLIEALRDIEICDVSLLNKVVEDFTGHLLILLGFWPIGKSLPEGDSLFSFVEDVIEKNLNSQKYFSSNQV